MKIQNLVHVRKIEGREKPVYTKCGVLMTKDDGTLSVHIDVIPVAGWNGWLSVFDQKDKSEGSGPAEKGESPF